MRIPKAKMDEMTEDGDWSLESYKFDEIFVESPTPDVAIIVYTVAQRGVMKGESRDLRAADSSTWIRGAQGWECVAHSETFLKDAV